MAQIQPFQFEPEYSTDEEGDESFYSSQTSSDDDREVDERASRLGDRTWCQCGNCVPMPTEKECVCCKEPSFLATAVEGMLNCAY